MKSIAFLLMAIMMSLSACSRKVSKATQASAYKATQAVQLTDTCSASWKLTTTSQVHYGDTLMGSMFFPNIAYNTIDADTLHGAGAWTTPATDSIESKGVKIVVALTPVNGGVNLQVKGISKPVTATQTTISEGSQSRSKDLKSITTAIATTEQLNKQVKTSYAGLVMGLAVFLLILSGIFLINKKFNLWQQVRKIL